MTNAIRLWALALIFFGAAGNEEEVKADAVEDYAAVKHPNEGVIVSVGEEAVADDPGEHADENHLLDAEANEEKGHDEEKNDFGHLAHGHFSGGVFHTGFGQEAVGSSVVEGKGDRDEKGAYY